MYRVRIASRHPSHKNILKQGQMPKFPARIRVRFGSIIPHRRVDIEINSPQSITNTANKIKMKYLFQENGVRTPKYLVNNEENRELIANGGLGEQTVFKIPYHSRGVGMVFFDNKNDASIVTKAGYFEESQVADREFRVHVMDGKAFYTDEKRPRERGHESVVKNMANGYKFRRPLRKYPPEVITESIKAVASLNLDFGAADVGLNSDGVWIYEVNSAPSLRAKTRKLYQKSLVRLIWKKILGEDKIDEVITKSEEYNEWLDEQPLTPHTDELNNI